MEPLHVRHETGAEGGPQRHLPVLSQWAAGGGGGPHCPGNPGPPATGLCGQAPGALGESLYPSDLQCPWQESTLLHRPFNNYKGFSDFTVGGDRAPIGQGINQESPDGGPALLSRVGFKAALKLVIPRDNKGTGVSNPLEK